MRTLTEQSPISLAELRDMATRRFGDLVKAVADIERGVLVVDAEMHSDQEAELLADGSNRKDLWGINLYPEVPEEDWLEFDSMINLVFLDFLVGPNEYRSTALSLQRYFDVYAIAARRHHLNDS